MGPPPSGSGNQTAPCRPTQRSSYFNGATAFRQWKWHHGRAVPARGDTSMGPPPSGSGNDRYLYVIDGESTDFNGATAFRQWKSQHALVQGSPAEPTSMGPPPSGSGNFHGGRAAESLDETSMGPPPSGSGNYSSPWTTRPRSPYFNGATAFRQWKYGASLGAADP